MNRLSGLLSQMRSFSSVLLQTKPFHIFNVPTAQLLTPQITDIMQTRGFKVRYKLRRRCKDCYMVVRNQRTYVLCPTHGRHKQMTPVKKDKYTWIIASASQSKIRPW